MYMYIHVWFNLVMCITILSHLLGNNWGKAPPSSKCVCLSVYVGLTIFKVNKLLTLIAGFAPSMFYILLVIMIIIHSNCSHSCSTANVCIVLLVLVSSIINAYSYFV